MALSQGRGDTALVLQTRVPSVLVLGSGGDSLGVIGQSGSGPGEFSTPDAVSIHADTIWISDIRGPVSRFEATGRFIDRVDPRPAPLGPFQYSPRFVGALADGTVLMQGVSNPVGREARAAVQALAYVRVNRSGSVIDTLALLSIRESGYVLEFPDGSGVVGSHPAANPDIGAVDPEGRWIVSVAQELDPDRTGFTVRWIGTEGDTLGEQRVQTVRVSSESIRADWIAALVDSERRPRGMIEAAVEEVAFPREVAPGLSVFLDPDGRAWVRSPHISPDSAWWYAVDRDRGSLGSVVLPTEIELLAARDGALWGWTRGEFDEPYILKFRIVW